MENIGKPKIEKSELVDDGGRTKIQPFNFLTDARKERLKDKREGEKRQSLDSTNGYKFGLGRLVQQTIMN